MPIRLLPTATTSCVCGLPAFLNRTLSTQRERKNVPGRIHVAVVTRATFGTVPRSYSKRAHTFRTTVGNYPAARARLGREPLVDVQEHSPVPAGLVAELCPEHRPASIEHGLCHPRLCQRGRVDVADRDQRVLSRNLGRRLVSEILAAVLDLGVYCLDAALIAGALSDGQPLLVPPINARSFDDSRRRYRSLAP